MKVLYINYNNFDRPINSASSMRPKKIYDTMQEMGYEVVMLTGELDKNTAKERNILVNKFMKEIANQKFDFCYIENLTTSFFKLYNYCDVRLIKMIAKKKIPIGVFYRDIYWKFFPSKGIRSMIYYFLQRWELKFYTKNCKTIFVPSEEMGKLLSSSKVVPLPPACQTKNAQIEVTLNAIVYIGACSIRYGTDILLNTMKIVNQTRSIDLNLVCRENEMEIINSFVKKEGALPSWLKVHHASDDALRAIYNASDAAILPLRKSPYNDFSIPVKIFEYISFLKPIVTTNCSEIEKIVTSNNIGIVKKDNPEDLAEGILKLYDLGISTYIPNLITYREKNTWVDRVTKITETLMK